MARQRKSKASIIREAIAKGKSKAAAAKAAKCDRQYVNHTLWMDRKKAKAKREAAKMKRLARKATNVIPLRKAA